MENLSTENVSIKSNTPTEDTIVFSTYNDNEKKPVAIMKPLRVQHPYIQLDSSSTKIPAAPTPISIALAAAKITTRRTAVTPATVTREDYH